MTVSRERAHSTTVESTTHTSSLQTLVSVAKERIRVRINPAALRRRDEVGVGQAGLEADLWPQGGQVRAVFQEACGPGIECLGEGVQVLPHNKTMGSLAS
ncbi:hypothetical protein GCM10027590_32910 [Nocardiopsis nanhaiensis]